MRAEGKSNVLQSDSPRGARGDAVAYWKTIRRLVELGPVIVASLAITFHIRQINPEPERILANTA